MRDRIVKGLPLILLYGLLGTLLQGSQMLVHSRVSHPQGLQLVEALARTFGIYALLATLLLASGIKRKTEPSPYAREKLAWILGYFALFFTFELVVRTWGYAYTDAFAIVIVLYLVAFLARRRVFVGNPPKR